MSWRKELWPEWQIEHDIGSGAYGTVYKIKRQDIGGTYYSALKVISFPHERNEVLVLKRKNMSDEQISEYYHQRALEVAREFAVMEKLKGNTNIVSYEDHKIVPHKNGLGWDVLIRMELLISLPDYLKTIEIDEGEVCKLGIDICNALILCEREKIIHRDIKPGNVFVNDYGDYKLGDFSLAKNVEIVAEKSTPKGTYSYMAPEVYKGQHYDYTIDIYSLGLILYRLLNQGRGPFQPLPPTAITPAITEEANYRRLHAEVLPKPVDASSFMTQIILKACAYQSEKRFRDAKEMQDSLIRCKALQEPSSISKQIANYIKKAMSTIKDLREELDGSDTNSQEVVDGVASVNDRDNKDITNKTNNKDVLQQVKKTMDDFFTKAGDL